MDKKKFERRLEQLAEYKPRLERWQSRPKVKDCEYCGRCVENQRVFCEVYIGGGIPHFRHRCMICRATVFDGSKSPALAKESKTLAK